MDLGIITREQEWLFDWKCELLTFNRDAYKLVIVDNNSVIQGLMSIEIKSDHVFMHLLESAPCNRGKLKTYIGVPGNLAAFACKLSFQNGHEGYVAFVAKSVLVNHYIDSIGATHLGGRLMIIDAVAAHKLVNRYLKR